MTAYKIALDISSVVAKIFFAAQADYRAGKTNDAAYMAAVKANREANAAFDIAYAAEVERVENLPDEIEAVDDAQLALL